MARAAEQHHDVAPSARVPDVRSPATVFRGANGAETRRSAPGVRGNVDTLPVVIPFPRSTRSVDETWCDCAARGRHARHVVIRTWSRGVSCSRRRLARRRRRSRRRGRRGGAPARRLRRSSSTLPPTPPSVASTAPSVLHEALVCECDRMWRARSPNIPSTAGRRETHRAASEVSRSLFANRAAPLSCAGLCRRAPAPERVNPTES